jgi:hypothetical protein
MRTLLRRGCMLLGLAVLPLLSGAAPMAEPSRHSREYQIKAAFLFNFARFVEWPAAAFGSSDSPLSLCVLGEDPFGSALDETVRGEKVRDRRLEVRRTSEVVDLDACQLVFVSASERGRLPEILSALGSKSVLTVSEVEEFAARGGVINFVLVDNRVRFEINPGAAKRSGLKISSELLRLGRIVDRDD